MGTKNRSSATGLWHITATDEWSESQPRQMKEGKKHGEERQNTFREQGGF
jgi:hypothetical protein